MAKRKLKKKVSVQKSTTKQSPEKKNLKKKQSTKKKAAADGKRIVVTGLPVMDKATKPKKKVPVCKKCGEEHWPFRPCEAPDVSSDPKEKKRKVRVTPFPDGDIPAEPVIEAKEKYVEIAEAAEAKPTDVEAHPAKAFGKMKASKDDDVPTLCGYLRRICRSKLARYTDKKEDAFVRLGAVLGTIYAKDGSTDVFENEEVNKIINEIKGYEKAIEQIERGQARKKGNPKHKIELKRQLLRLKSKDIVVRKSALRMLEKLKDSKAIPYLVQVVESPDDKLRAEAKESIHKLIDAAAAKV